MWVIQSVSLSLVDTETQAAVAAYRCRSMPAEAGVFARATVAVVGPASAGRARALLWACARLASFGLATGLDAEPAVLLHPSVIERFILTGVPQLSDAARRTLRTNLRHVADRMGPPRPAPVALSRQRAKAPYSEAALSAYLALADAQPTVARRMRAQALICLGAGAGVVGADLRGVRGTDVVARSGGVVVDVNGRRPRSVPVLARYQDRLVASASFAAEGPMIGGVDPGRHNVTTPLVSSLAGGADLARLDTARLRATWVAVMAERLGLKAFLGAAGISCTQRLGDVVATLATPTEAVAVALLGAGR